MIAGGEDARPANTLIPPRPNLGPEPWDEGGGAGLGTMVGVGAVVAIAILLAGWGWTRSRRRRRGPERIAPTTDDPGPTDPWITASEAARAALIRLFGPSWRSKTTEEIAADAALGDRLGPDRFEDLIALFLRADRAKFAADGPSEDDPDGGDLPARALAALEALVPEPGDREAPDGR